MDLIQRTCSFLLFLAGDPIAWLLQPFAHHFTTDSCPYTERELILFLGATFRKKWSMLEKPQCEYLHPKALYESPAVLREIPPPQYYGDTEGLTSAEG